MGAVRAQGTAPADAIKHVVVIFQENVSFDHYFATYPVALNPVGEPAFHSLAKTPKVDGLSGALLTANPNFLNEANGNGRANPFRLRRDQAVTADQDHNYQAEQLAYNHGKMDLFPKSVGSADGPRVPGDHTGVPSSTLNPPPLPPMLSRLVATCEIGVCEIVAIGCHR